MLRGYELRAEALSPQMSWRRGSADNLPSQRLCAPEISPALSKFSSRTYTQGPEGKQVLA